MIDALVQFSDGARGVAALCSGAAYRVKGAETTLALAHAALAAGATLAQHVGEQLGDRIDLATVRLLCPIDHPDAAHLLVSGTGLTHLGSAEGRDAMHRAAKDNPDPTD
ncbi:MAG: FAH family protein, partial [Blastomonas sp.]|nr:FAH family protein [Blastomonas sp.]